MIRILLHLVQLIANFGEKQYLKEEEERRGKERRGEERKGKERKGKERKGEDGVSSKDSKTFKNIPNIKKQTVP